MTERPKFFRKHFVVARAAQFSYGAAFAIFAVTSALGIIGAGVMVLYSPIDVTCPDGTPGCSAYFLTPDQWRSFAIGVAILTVPAGLVAFALGLIVSHRTFGPLVRIREFVDQITKGNYAARLKLRDKDHLQELVPVLNEMAEALQKRHS